MAAPESLQIVTNTMELDNQVGTLQVSKSKKIIFLNRLDITV